MNNHEEVEGRDLLEELSGIKGLEKVDEGTAIELKKKLAKQDIHKFKIKGKTYLRKKRIPLPPHVKERLEHAFQSNIVPRGRHGRPAKEKLAQELGLTFDVVHKWFDNRRIKDNLQNKRLINLMDNSTGQEEEKQNHLKRTYDEITSHSLIEAEKHHDTMEQGGIHAPLPLGGLESSSSIAMLASAYNSSNTSSSSSSSSSSMSQSTQQQSTLKRPRREANIGGKLEQNNFSSPENITPEVRNAFRLVRHFLNGEVDLGKVIRDCQLHDGVVPSEPYLVDIEDPMGRSIFFNKRTRRKALVPPTLNNVIENTFSKGSVFYPIVNAIQTITGSGASNALFALVEMYEQNFRTLLIWHAISKHSGHKMCEYIFKALSAGLQNSFESIPVAEQMEKFFPMLVEQKDQPVENPNAIFSMDSTSIFGTWSEQFILDLFLNQKVTREDGEQGLIVQITPPQYNRKEPQFKVLFTASNVEEYYTWDEIKGLISPTFHLHSRNIS